MVERGYKLKDMMRRYRVGSASVWKWIWSGELEVVWVGPPANPTRSFTVTLEQRVEFEARRSGVVKVKARRRRRAEEPDLLSHWRGD